MTFSDLVTQAIAGRVARSLYAAEIHSTAAKAARVTAKATDAQSKAGNYRKGRFRWHRLVIAIENPKGSTRSGVSRDGKHWQSVMTAHYGYVTGMEPGRDKDPVDVYFGPESDATTVYVVDQIDPHTGQFDEHKCMLGYSSQEAARQGYLSNYEAGWRGLGAITPLPVEKFREWLKSGDKHKPMSRLTMGGEAGVRRVRMTYADVLRRRLMYAAGTATATQNRSKGPGVHHAPAGGATVGGKHFTGGEFIPGEVMAKASAAERQAVDGKGAARGATTGPAVTKPKAAPSEPKKPAKIRAAAGEMVGARRTGEGKDARLILADGREAPSHIKPGMVPAAWSDVQLNLDPSADVLVRGRDKKGRSQTVYSDAFHMRTAAAKFARIREMYDKAIDIHYENQANRHDPALRDAADCAWLIEQQATRPGSESDTGAKVKAYGATTLRGEHVIEAEDGVRLRFIGKEGVSHDHLIRNPELAKMLLDRKATADERGGRLFNVDEKKLNQYIGKLDGGLFTAKDFRTLKANQLATTAIREIGDCCESMKTYKQKVKEVAERVSHVLGNRPVQALESYIDPTVFSVWRQGAGETANA